MTKIWFDGFQDGQNEKPMNVWRKPETGQRVVRNEKKGNVNAIKPSNCPWVRLFGTAQFLGDNEWKGCFIADFITRPFLVQWKNNSPNYPDFKAGEISKVTESKRVFGILLNFG